MRKTRVESLFGTGSPVSGTPVPFEVNSAAPVPAQSRLEPPPNAEHLVANMDEPVVVMLHTCDKYGNPCQQGGLRVAAKNTYVKQNSNDITILSPNNNSVTAEDLQNGSYVIKVALQMACTVKLIVNMDKDLPGTSGELPGIQLVFVSEARTEPPPLALQMLQEERKAEVTAPLVEEFCERLLDRVATGDSRSSSPVLQRLPSSSSNAVDKAAPDDVAEPPAADACAPVEVE